MRFDIADPVPLSAEETFQLVRDDMPALVPYMEDVERIEVLERTEADGKVHIVNEWHATDKSVPAGIRKMVPKELLGWKDHADWDTATRSCSWRLEPRKGGDVFACSGTTRVEDAGDGTARLALTIDLEIHPEKIRGIPKFLGTRIRGQVESVLGKLLTSNMKNLGKSIRAYAEAEGKV